MPEHPAKAADPVAWAKETAEREKNHAAGYPSGSISRAFADVIHGLDRIAGRLHPNTSNAALKLGLAAAAALAVHLLTRRKPRRYFIRDGEVYYVDLKSGR